MLYWDNPYDMHILTIKDTSETMIFDTFDKAEEYVVNNSLLNNRIVMVDV